MIARRVNVRDATHTPPVRGGFVLPAAIMALVVISTLVAGAMFVSTEELRAGRADLASHRAFAAAEVALERAIAAWSSELTLTLRVGESRTMTTSGDARGDTAIVTATRVLDGAFWVTARGTSRADGRSRPARTTIGASMRLLVPALPLSAALTVGGSVTIDGGTVAGSDVGVSVDALACPGEPSADVAGIIAADSTRVCGGECGAVPAGVTGAPPLATGGSLTSDSAATSGGWPGLASRATFAVAGGELLPRPVASDGVCDRADPLNWGDPAGGVCANHVPVIRITGDVVLAPGSIGQGILIVDGSLTVTSGARFAGIVLVRDDVTVAGSGAAIDGVVVALDANAGAGSAVRDGGSVRFARCAARRALLAAASLARTPERWWAELR